MKLPEKEWEELRTLQRLYTRELPVLDGYETGGAAGTGDGAIGQPFDPENTAIQAASTHQNSNPPTANAAATMGSLDMAGTGYCHSQREAMTLSDNHFDSVVDMCAAGERKEKRKWRNNSVHDGEQDRSTVPVAESRWHDGRHRKRQRLRRVDEELGICQES